jgi:molecular chaperone GrpE
VSSDNASRDGPADERPKQPEAASKGADDRNVEAYDEALTGDDRPGGGDAIPNEIEQLRQELARAEDRALRTQAELENYRKRAARQIDEERRYANVPLMRDLLPVWDNMGRAIEAGEKADQPAGLLEGFRLVAVWIQLRLR